MVSKCSYSFCKNAFLKRGACWHYKRWITLGLCDTKNGLIGIVNSNNFAVEKVIFCLQSPGPCFSSRVRGNKSDRHRNEAVGGADA